MTLPVIVGNARGRFLVVVVLATAEHDGETDERARDAEVRLRSTGILVVIIVSSSRLSP